MDHAGLLHGERRATLEALRSGDLSPEQAPESHGARPRVTVTIDHQALVGHRDRTAPATLEGTIDWPILGLDD